MKMNQICGMCGSIIDTKQLLNIEQNVALNMLRQARDKMYDDLKELVTLDSPKEHYSIENLWDIARELTNC